LAPTRAKADEVLNLRLKTASTTGDANDILYQWESSRDYNPLAGLEKIKATLLAINSADDERNPPELGVMERELKRIPGARLLLLPASDQTSGHGTTGQAKWWKDQVAELLKNAPHKAPRTPQ
jgi:homoserine O-acetyltransferase